MMMMIIQITKLMCVCVFFNVAMPLQDALLDFYFILFFFYNNLLIAPPSVSGEDVHETRVQRVSE